jgi:phosphoserine phosphatase
MQRHGRAVYVVSAALQEIGDCVARELGLDGALGSRAETRDWRVHRSCRSQAPGQAKADAVVDFATSERLDLSASIAYSDSHTDFPFSKPSEARWPSIRIAGSGGSPSIEAWPVRRFTARAFAAE